MLDKQQIRRFQNEARAAATLDHPGIVSIYSVGCERGVHYYAMQLIEGQTLEQVIKELQHFAENNELQEGHPLPTGQLTSKLASGSSASGSQTTAQQDRYGVQIL